MRSFVALSRAQAAGRGARGARRPRPAATRSARSARSPSTRSAASSARSGPDRITRAHDGAVATLADPVGRPGQAPARESARALLRKHGKGIVDQGMAHKRLADALRDVYAQIAVLSRVTSIFEEQGVEASGQERFIAETFCTRAGAPRRRASSTSSSATTTSACTRSRGWPTSAARTATRCSRTDARTCAHGRSLGHLRLLRDAGRLERRDPRGSSARLLRRGRRRPAARPLPRDRAADPARAPGRPLPRRDGDGAGGAGLRGGDGAARRRARRARPLAARTGRCSPRCPRRWPRRTSAAGGSSR